MRFPIDTQATRLTAIYVLPPKGVELSQGSIVLRNVRAIVAGREARPITPRNNQQRPEDRRDEIRSRDDFDRRIPGDDRSQPEAAGTRSSPSRAQRNRVRQRPFVLVINRKEDGRLAGARAAVQQHRRLRWSEHDRFDDSPRCRNVERIERKIYPGDRLTVFEQQHGR